MKQIITWEPKAVQHGKKQSWTGVFRTRVAPGTQGSVKYSGQLATGKSYEYHGIDVTQVSGHIRWIDIVLPSYDGADPRIMLYVEGEKAMHRIEMRYDASTLHNVCNLLAGLGKDLPTQFINFNYWVRPKTDAQGNPVYTTDGKVRLQKTFQITDVKPQYSFDEWKKFEAENGLEWTQRKRPGGKTEWEMDAAIKYWDSRLVAMQRYLLKSGSAVPFTWGSITCTEIQNPSGGGNLTAEEIALAKSIYESRKADFQFGGSRERKDADSIVGAAVVPGYSEDNEDTGAFEPEPSGFTMPDMQTSEPAQPTPDDFSDLPF